MSVTQATSTGFTKGEEPRNARVALDAIAIVLAQTFLFVFNLVRSLLQPTLHLRGFKREVSRASILQLGFVHTHMRSVTASIVTRHTAAIVSSISDVQRFTKLTALTHSIISTIVTYIKVSFVGTLAMLVTQALDRAVSRCPTKVTLAFFRSNTATLDTAFGADWLAGSWLSGVIVSFSTNTVETLCCVDTDLCKGVTVVSSILALILQGTKSGGPYMRGIGSQVVCFTSITQRTL